MNEWIVIVAFEPRQLPRIDSWHHHFTDARVQAETLIQEDPRRKITIARADTNIEAKMTIVYTPLTKRPA